MEGSESTSSPDRSPQSLQARIDELERANAGLREDARRLRLMLEQMPALLWTTDAELRVTHASGGGLSILGLGPRGGTGHSLYEYSEEPGPQAQPIAEHLRALQGESVNFEMDWHGHAFRSHVEPLRDPQGSIVGTIGTALLVTEKKRAEEALLASERRHKSLLEAIPDLIFVLSRDGTYLDFKAPRRETLAIPAAQVIGSNVRDIGFSAYYLDLVLSSVEKALDSGSLQTLEYELQTERGLGQFEARLAPLNDREVLCLVRDISARRRAEEERRRSEERFRFVSRATNDAVWDWDLTTNTVWKNENGHKLFGYRADQVRPEISWWSERIHPEDRQRVLHGLEALIASGEPSWHDEYRFLRGDGSHAYVQDRGYVIHDERGLPVRMIGAMLDITERKRAETALRDSEERYRVLAESSAVGIWQIDLDGSTVYLNPAMCELLQVPSVEAVANKTYHEFFTPDSLERMTQEHEKRSSGEASSYEVELIGAEGRRSIVVIGGAPLLGADGSLTGLIGTFTDISERKAAEQRLRQSEMLLAEAQHIARLGSWELDLRSNVLTWSDEMFRIMGVEPTPDRKVPFDTVEALTHPEDLAGLQKEKADRIRGQQPIRLDHRIVRPDGAVRHIHVMGRLAQDRSESGSRYIGTVQDITERVQAEEERRRLEAQIQQTQKLESLGILAGGIAHDFNNLLMGILGNVGLALLEMPARAPARQYVEQIEDVALHAAELTNQMLAYSGRGKFVVQPVDVSRLLRDMTHLLEMVISKKARLQFQLTEPLPLIEADATQLRQVLMNLVTNASEAIGEHTGLITVSTGLMDADASFLAQAYPDGDLPAGRYVYVQVVDTGSGMDESTRKRIFEPFFTTKFTGRGLGLAAVLGIVRGHGGGIRLVSDPGRGTTFTVLFPCPEVPLREAAEERMRQGAQSVPEGATILVVDDEEVIRTVVRTALQRFGFEVLTAGDGREAVEVYREHAGRIGAVLLDMTMPKMSGDEAYREMRRIRPDVRVILSSGYTEQEATDRFGGEGLAAFIQKPYQPLDLLAKILGVLDDHGTTRDF